MLTIFRRTQVVIFSLLILCCAGCSLSAPVKREVIIKDFVSRMYADFYRSELTDNWNNVPYRANISSFDEEFEILKNIMIEMTYNDPNMTLKLISNPSGGGFQNNSNQDISFDELKNMWLTLINDPQYFTLINKKEWPGKQAYFLRGIFIERTKGLEALNVYTGNQLEGVAGFEELMTDPPKLVNYRSISSREFDIEIEIPQSWDVSYQLISFAPYMINNASAYFRPDQFILSDKVWQMTYIKEDEAQAEWQLEGIKKVDRAPGK